LLEKFYKRDIESQTLSRKEAADLSARWMLPCDVRFEVEYNKWPETSSTLMLGGRGQEGAPVFNEITKNFLEAHKKYNLINPKLNCRFNSETPEAYLREISRQIISGRNVFALLNDDCIIEANVKAGRAVEDCRLYTAGGCQEIIIEGMEHSAAAYYYFNLPRALTLFLYDRENAIKTGMKAEFKDYRNFQSLYDDALSFTGKLISQGASLRVSAGRAWPEVNPCPLFSSMMNECVKKHRDFTQGGTKYSPSGISLVGFGTFVDSLYALKKLCFEEKIVTFGDFRKILASNWKGMESLRVQAVKVDAPDRIATETVGRISEICSRLENERGGHFQPSFFAYYLFARMAPETPATPDGRKAGELLSQGIAPGCLKKAESFSDAVMTLGKIDFTEVPGSSVLDVQLPSGTVNSENLVSLIKTFGKIKGPILQPGAVSVEELRDAVKNPEKHKNLTVRISGLSARFISLDGDVQKEIINRNMMS
jgi:formate C-acetyltransferase